MKLFLLCVTLHIAWLTVNRPLHLNLKMASLQLDPKAPLSSKDLALMLMQNCTTRLIEERSYTKELINEKAETVVEGLVKGMGEVNAAVVAIIKEQSENIVNLELKLDTCSAYLEQLLYQQMSVSTSNPPTGSFT